MDADEIELLTPKDRQRIIRTCLYEMLTQQYPMQYLLRGKLQMMADGYLELNFDRIYGIRPAEWKALRVYCQKNIYPLLSYNYQHGANLEHQRIAGKFTSDVRRALTGVLANMIARGEEISKTSDEDIIKWSAEKAIRNLCVKDFLCVPVIGLQLWDMFRVCSQ